MPTPVHPASPRSPLPATFLRITDRDLDALAETYDRDARSRTADFDARTRSGGAATAIRDLARAAPLLGKTGRHEAIASTGFLVATTCPPPGAVIMLNGIGGTVAQRLMSTGLFHRATGGPGLTFEQAQALSTGPLLLLVGGEDDTKD